MTYEDIRPTECVLEAENLRGRTDRNSAATGSTATARCCCVVSDPYDCVGLRYGEDPREVEDPCDCPCHDQWMDDDGDEEWP